MLVFCTVYLCIAHDYFNKNPLSSWAANPEILNQFSPLFFVVVEKNIRNKNISWKIYSGNGKQYMTYFSNSYSSLNRQTLWRECGHNLSLHLTFHCASIQSVDNLSMTAKAHGINHKSAKWFVFISVEFWEVKLIKYNSENLNLNKAFTVWVFVLQSTPYMSLTLTLSS